MPNPILTPIHSVPQPFDFLDRINQELEKFRSNNLREPNVIIVHCADYYDFLRENEFPYLEQSGAPVAYGAYRIFRTYDIARREIIVS